jgi:hypothetical protein
VLLTWEDRGIEALYPVQIEEHLLSEHYRLAEELAGHGVRNRGRVACRLALLRALADNTGLTGGLSPAPGLGPAADP